MSNSLLNAINNYKEGKAASESKLGKAIYDALIETGLKFGRDQIEETSIAIVRGHDVMFTAYLCIDTEIGAPPFGPDDISLGSDIDSDSLVLYA